MSFTKHSNFNPKANFSEVKFGENMPVLEVELNEMQQIQNEARADMIRDSIHSGFVKLGDIDYEYCKSNNNQIKLKTESIAYVNGYRITIPKDTIIEIGESDKVREDLVFLEVWKEVVTNESDLKEYGGEQNADIDNPIKDERYPIATSQRVALKYRIRHVADLNFNYSYSSATSSNLHPYIGWNGDKNFSPVYAMGGNNSLECPKQILGEEIFRSANKEWRNVAINDSGLWIAGLPETDERCTKERYKTIDGYVYAIPMFRLKRKPNVGLASPFEYKKIHPQINPKKFAHLVGQENVEKVHSVEIAGRTYNNHTLNTKDISLRGHGSFVGFHLQHSAVSKPLKTDTDYLFIINVKSNTLVGDNYSLDFGETDPSNSSQQSCFTSQFRLPLNALGFSTHILHTKNSFDGVYCVSRTQLSNSAKSGNIVFDYMIIEYSPELVDIDFIPYFEGVKSLGELTNNSITVENNLVKEGVYVPELQNHILPTHPEVTHVTWGEDVVIPPEVEIELKRGEELLQTITQLPVKLETTGEEKLHVKTLKGRTLVNAHPVSTPELAIPNIGVYEPTVSENYIKVKYLGGTISWKYINFKMPNYSLLKPNTKYFVVFEEAKNITHVRLSNGDVSKVCSTQGELQNNWCIITTNDLLNTNEVFMYISFNDKGVVGSETIAKNPMIIEYQEGMENWGLKYFTGMKSVEEPNIKVFGANLVDTQLAYVNKKYSNDSCWSVIKTKGNSVTSMASGVTSSNDYRGFGVSIPVYTVKPNTTYVLKSKLRENNVEVTSQMFVYCNSRTWGNAISTGVDKIQFTTPSDCEYLTLGLGYCLLKNGKVIEVYDIELIELDYAGNDYSSQSPTRLKTPKGTVLRSLPNGNSDTLTFNTGTRNNTVKELRLLNMGVSGSFSTDTHTTYILGLTDAIGGTNIYCNSFIPGSAYTTDSYERITINTAGTQLALRVSNSRLGDLSMNEYLQLNPVFVQYGLSTPLNKKIEVSEDDYVGKSKVTYQLAEPLNYIPNGAYDEIKGDKLIKRTNKIYLDGTETWSSFLDETATTYRTSFNIPDAKPSSVCVCSHFEYETGATVEKVKIYMTVNANLSITVLKSDFPTVDSFKTWLSNNRPMVIYELANPIEIPLKEVSPLECDFSYYRQFDSKYTGYPKELPNGVRDVVIGKGIIKRYTRHLTFNGTESWNALSTDGDVVRAFVNVTTSENLKPKAISEILNSYKLPFGTSSITREEIGVDQNSNIVLALAKSRLSSADLSGFKNYLGQNPIQVILEVNSPYQNTVTEDKCKPIPYMPLNSYVGSLYVADGNNHTKFLTDFSPSEYEVQTYHRYFSNEFNVFEDIKRKKSPYGHKTYLEEVEGKYVEKFTAGLEKHEIEDLRHKVSLTGFDYNHLLQDSFLKLIKGELS